MTAKETFTRIFEDGAWNSAESASGTGSTLAETEPIRALLPGLLKRLCCKTILDLPCGDWNWMQHVDLSGVDYTGGDIVDAVIEGNRAKYAAPNRRFEIMDILTGPLPKADLILSRDCLVHFSHADAMRAINNIRESGARYLLATTYPDHYKNTGHGNLAITTGQWYPINLAVPPFNLGRPLQIHLDGCPTPGYTDKSLGLWLASTLPHKLGVL
jgi:SAM-dependent methyltransferase